MTGSFNIEWLPGGASASFVVANKVARIAMVSTSAITAMQQRRVTTAPGMHDPSTVSFHQDLDEAVAEGRNAVTN
ncbi:MAG TPA: hypothetical protein VIJ31_15660 [Acidothermaceae bacterium]